MKDDYKLLTINLNLFLKISISTSFKLLYNNLIDSSHLI